MNGQQRAETRHQRTTAEADTIHPSPFTIHPGKPWYREPWPWLLMAGPAAVIVAGAVTLWLAIMTNDGLVADDYYRRGLAINQTLARDRTAAALGYRAAVTLDERRGVEVKLSGGNARPPALLLTIAHSTRSNLDIVVALQATGGNVYRAPPVRLPAGRWRVILEDEAGTWRLGGERELTATHSFMLVSRPD